MPKVSIHLVIWNGEKYLEDCLNSILNQSFKDYFLLIIDNGSVDHSVKIIEQRFVPLFGDKIRFVKNKSNLGFARAHNQAILWTDSEYVMVLNQDVILENNFLEGAIKFLDNHKEAASLSGKILRWEFDKEEELKKSQKSDIIDSLGLKIFKSQKVVDLGAGEKDNGQFGETKEIFGVSAPCPIYRRQALAEVRFEDEFFDNDFFSYKEDVDLAYRLKWRGWKSYYLPLAIAYHERTAKSREKAWGLKIISQRKNKTQFVNYHSYKNHFFILEKNLSPKNFRRYFFHIFFYEFKKFIYLLFFERSTLGSLKEFFAKKKQMKEKRKFIMKNRLVKDEEIRKWFS